MDTATESRVAASYAELEPHFAQWETVKDIIDQLIHITVNLRQSGHPGGSLSKVHAFVVTLLSGVMRYDLRHPAKRFGDRFIFAGGHVTPLLYSTLAVCYEALRIKYQQTGDPKYLVPGGADRAVYPEDLVTFRRNKGLSGHVEMEGKTLFHKFNSGPSGHALPAAAGEALALKRAGAGQVKVITFEGEGGFTTGVTHETQNSAWGLGLDNLYFVVDWNNYGIDDRPFSEVIYGNPDDWFSAHGWRTFGAEQGCEWGPVTRAMLETHLSPNADMAPSATWVKTLKGRGYLVYNNKSHGAPHAPDGDVFWQTKKPFADKYGVQFQGFGQPAPADPAAFTAQTLANIQVVMDVLRRDQALVDYLADRLVELGDSVPAELSTFRLNTAANPLNDPLLYDAHAYPADLYAKPGEKLANRNALAKWGAWVNAWSHAKYGRPLFLVASADLAESTNIAGFGKAYGDFAGYGWFERNRNPEGIILPQGITEFATAGMLTGAATVNFAEDPEKEFNGFLGACSTYGSFVYLKYGSFRVYSQLAQDCQLKTGKILWVAGHSGPETADDFRTHFGIFSPGVTQLFPDGKIVNLHPWEYNEVPVVLAAALKHPAPIIALHLTRPAIPIPDRQALGMASHFEAAKGAYVVRDYRPGPRAGCVIAQGTSAVESIVENLPRMATEGPNVKIVAAISHELFEMQPAAYRDTVLSPGDRASSMCVTTQARVLMHPWLFNKVAEEYTLSSDWDNRWRTGGTVAEVIEEAHLSPHWVLDGIQRFARDREQRLSRMRAGLDEAGR
jgi:transketolase